MSSLRRDSVEGKTKARFALSLVIGLLLFVGGWYVLNSCSGVFGRSTETVKFSQWTSWNAGSIYFGDTTGNYNDTKENIFFRYEEKSGSVKVIVNEKVYMVMTRFDDNLLLTSDGQNAFYYKGEWSK